MRISADNSSRIVRGADGALYRVTKGYAACVKHVVEEEPAFPDEMANGMSSWRVLDNGSARTFIAPKGH